MLNRNSQQKEANKAEKLLVTDIERDAKFLHLTATDMKLQRIRE